MINIAEQLILEPAEKLELICRERQLQQVKRRILLGQRELYQCKLSNIAFIFSSSSLLARCCITSGIYINGMHRDTFETYPLNINDKLNVDYNLNQHRRDEIYTQTNT